MRSWKEAIGNSKCNWTMKENIIVNAYVAVRILTTKKCAISAGQVVLCAAILLSLSQTSSAKNVTKKFASPATSNTTNANASS